MTYLSFALTHVLIALGLLLAFGYIIWELQNRRLKQLGISWKEYLYNKYVTRGINIAYLQKHNSALQRRSKNSSKRRSKIVPLILVHSEAGGTYFKVNRAAIAALSEDEWKYLFGSASKVFKDLKQAREVAAIRPATSEEPNRSYPLPLVRLMLVAALGGAVAGVLMLLFDFGVGSLDANNWSRGSWSGATAGVFLDTANPLWIAFPFWVATVAAIGALHGLIFALLLLVARVFWLPNFDRWIIAVAALYGVIICQVEFLFLTHPPPIFPPFTQFFGFAFIFGPVLGAFVLSTMGRSAHTGQGTIDVGVRR